MLSTFLKEGVKNPNTVLLLVLFVSFFAAIIISLFRPGAKKKYDNISKMPLGGE